MVLERLVRDFILVSVSVGPGVGVGLGQDGDPSLVRTPDQVKEHRTEGVQGMRPD